MADFVERQVGVLTVRIDRTTCAAFRDCIGIAPEAFALDDEGIVAFTHSEGVDREKLIEACAVCPVDALAVFDENGEQLVP